VLMRTVSILAALAAIAGVALAAGDDAASADAAFTFDHVSCHGGDNEIRVIVTGIKKSQGLITADLYPNKQDGFLRGRGRLLQVHYAAKSPATKFCVDAPEGGLFAMSVYHDKNANGDFDKTGLGLPDEPWGISNNPRVLFGPPPVEEALFEVGEHGARVQIKLN